MGPSVETSLNRLGYGYVERWVWVGLGYGWPKPEHAKRILLTPLEHDASLLTGTHLGNLQERGLQRATRRGPWQTEMISTAFIVGNMLLLLIYSILPLFPMPPLPSPVPSEAPHGVPPHKALQVLEYVAKTSMLVPWIVALHCAMSTLVCSFYLLQQTYIGIVRPLLSLSCLSLFYAWHWKVLSKAFAVRY